MVYAPRAPAELAEEDAEEVAEEFDDALRAHGLRAFMGQDARQQPGSLQEVMLHETAVAWWRSLLSQSTPRAPAEDTRDAYLTRLREACAHVNDNFDVDGLSWELPGGVQQHLELKGDKLPKCARDSKAVNSPSSPSRSRQLAAVPRSHDFLARGGDVR